MDVQETFNDHQRVLEILTSSHRQLLTAQVIMSDVVTRTEKNLETATRQISELADSIKQTDDKVDALADMVRQLIERKN